MRTFDYSEPLTLWIIAQVNNKVNNIVKYSEHSVHI